MDRLPQLEMQAVTAGMLTCALGCRVLLVSLCDAACSYRTGCSLELVEGTAAYSWSGSQATEAHVPPVLAHLLCAAVR